jgi:hypothetical protein
MLCEDRLFFVWWKMLDLHLCLSASVDVRYILHTQPLRFIYNKILVFVSLYPCLSLSIFGGLSFLPPTHFCYRCMLSLHLPHLFFPISSTLTLPTTKDGIFGIFNTNCHGNNNVRNPPSLYSWVVVGHVDLPFRDLGDSATCQSKRCHPWKEDHHKERWNMMLARLWMKGLRSNTTP